MKTITYTAETPAQALKMVRDEYGDDALIIETKEIRKKTLNQAGLFELVIGVPDDAKKAEQPKLLATNSIQKRLEEIAEKEIARKKRERDLNNMFDEEVTIQLSDAVREISKIATQTNLKKEPKKLNKTETPESKIQNLEVDSILDSNKDEKIESKQASQDKVESNIDAIEFKEIKETLKNINDKIKLIQNSIWEHSAPQNLSVSVPKEFAEIYRIAKDSGMALTHLDEIMKLSVELMPLKMREQSALIKRYFREILRKMIFCRQESEDKKIIMLVGPTGVGKTTTLAKLAARYSQMLESKKKVGIITLDDYRIGAVEQLAWYARKMRISLDSVNEKDDFLSKLDSLNYCDYVLIDTAGHSQYDKERINELKYFVKNSNFDIDVSLVLSAATKFEDLVDCFKSFGELDIDTLIFSKLDESRGLGNIFSLVYETKKPISYLSIGQEVPSDIIVADNNYLADCLINGFSYPYKD